MPAGSLKVRISRPLARSHSFTACPPDTAKRPSGENATLVRPNWPIAGTISIRAIMPLPRPPPQGCAEAG